MARLYAVLDHNRHAGRRHAFGTVTLTFELHLRGLVVDPDPARGQIQSCHAGVGVELFVNELGHGSLAVADDGGGLLRGQRHQLAPHHQQAVFGALGEFLDNHAAAFVAPPPRRRPAPEPRGSDLVNTRRAGCIARLHYHGRAISSAACPASVRVADQAPLGNRNANRRSSSWSAPCPARFDSATALVRSVSAVQIAALLGPGQAGPAAFV